MDSFSKFYRANKEKLFGYLMRMTGDYQASCDTMQESFTRLLKHYGLESQNTSLLFKIARNAALDNVRKQAQNEQLEGKKEDCGHNPEQILPICESYRNVLAALHCLEETERDILSLVVSSELSYSEIANITGMSEVNVRVKVHRARVKLRKILKRGNGR